MDDGKWIALIGVLCVIVLVLLTRTALKWRKRNQLITQMMRGRHCLLGVSYAGLEISQVPHVLADQIKESLAERCDKVTLVAPDIVKDSTIYADAEAPPFTKVMCVHVEVIARGRSVYMRLWFSLPEMGNLAMVEHRCPVAETELLKKTTNLLDHLLREAKLEYRRRISARQPKPVNPVSYPSVFL